MTKEASNKKYILLPLIVLCSCTPDGELKRECLKFHTEKTIRINAKYDKIRSDNRQGFTGSGLRFG